MAKKTNSKVKKTTDTKEKKTENKVSGKVKVKALTPQWLSGDYVGANSVIEVEPAMAALLLSKPNTWVKV